MSLIGLKSRAKKEGWSKWIGSDADEHALTKGCYFDESKAEHAASFFPTYLRHSKGQWADKPFDLLDWQCDGIVYPLFGWMRANGTRRYRITYIEIPKKNGKSTLAAGVGLYLSTADGERGSYIFSCATDKEQAGIVHNEAIQMVESSPELSAEMSINRSTKHITHPASGSKYRAIAAVPRGQEGHDAHGMIVDELHAWYGRELWDALKYAGRGRTQPLRFVITTAGDDELSVCYEQYEYAKGVLEGNFHDPRFFAYIREAEESLPIGDDGAEEHKGDDLYDPEVWAKANPSMGVTIDPEEFKADLEEAARTPSAWATFKRYSFNIWATSTNPWFDVHDWDRCHQDFTEADCHGAACCIGLDLSKTQDSTAMVLVFRDPDDEESYRVLPRFYLPKDTAVSLRGKVPWEIWEQQGLVVLTPGNTCDYQFVKRDFLEICDQFDVRKLFYDPYHAEDITQQMSGESGVDRVDFRQTLTNYADPSEEFERLILKGKMHHNGHSVMRWQIGNAKVYEDANSNKRPVKPKRNDYRKIDGVVAAIMGLAAAQTIDFGPSVYASRGLVYFDV